MDAQLTALRDSTFAQNISTFGVVIILNGQGFDAVVGQIDQRADLAMGGFMQLGDVVVTLSVDDWNQSSASAGSQIIVGGATYNIMSFAKSPNSKVVKLTCEKLHA